MSLIGRWIEKTYKQKVKIVESKTTSSTYYIVNGYRIRTSDHFTPNKDESDMDIILPMNSNTVYLVIKAGNLTPMTYGFHELKFIIDWEINNRVISDNNVKVSNNKSLYFAERLNEIDLDDCLDRTKDVNWGFLMENKIQVDFPKYKNLTTGIKTSIKSLFKSSVNVPYSDCEVVIRQIIQDQSSLSETKNLVEFILDNYAANNDIFDLITSFKNKSYQTIESDTSITNVPTIANSEFRTNGGNWSKVVNYICADFPEYHKCTAGQKKLIKKVFEHEKHLDYTICIAICKNLKKDGWPSDIEDYIAKAA